MAPSLPFIALLACPHAGQGDDIDVLVPCPAGTAAAVGDCWVSGVDALWLMGSGGAPVPAQKGLVVQPVPLGTQGGMLYRGVCRCVAGTGIGPLGPTFPTSLLLGAVWDHLPGGVSLFWPLLWGAATMVWSLLAGCWIFLWVPSLCGSCLFLGRWQ